MTAQTGIRRLFEGDLHGSLNELNDLLDLFGFVPGQDTLFSVGDVVGKGPHVLGLLHRLRELKAFVVRGNHDAFLLKAASLPESQREPRDKTYLSSLGLEETEWLKYISAWPVYLDLPDIILVHGGLEPGKKSLADMSPKVMMKIRTWDGEGKKLYERTDPPWFECVQTDKTVVFGHWAERGLIDLPKFKGLDSGCVYGGTLTGWCPEENRFVQVKAQKQYAEIHFP